MRMIHGANWDSRPHGRTNNHSGDIWARVYTDENIDLWRVKNPSDAWMILTTACKGMAVEVMKIDDSLGTAWWRQ